MSAFSTPQASGSSVKKRTISVESVEFSEDERSPPRRRLRPDYKAGSRVGPLSPRNATSRPLSTPSRRSRASRRSLRPRLSVSPDSDPNPHEFRSGILLGLVEAQSNVATKDVSTGEKPREDHTNGSLLALGQDTGSHHNAGEPIEASGSNDRVITAALGPLFSVLHHSSDTTSPPSQDPPMALIDPTIPRALGARTRTLTLEVVSDSDSEGNLTCERVSGGDFGREGLRSNSKQGMATALEPLSRPWKQSSASVKKARPGQRDASAGRRKIELGSDSDPAAYHTPSRPAYPSGRSENPSITKANMASRNRHGGSATGQGRRTLYEDSASDASEEELRPDVRAVAGVEVGSASDGAGMVWQPGCLDVQGMPVNESGVAASRENHLQSNSVTDSSGAAVSMPSTGSLLRDGSKARRIEYSDSSGGSNQADPEVTDTDATDAEDTVPGGLISVPRKEIVQRVIDYSESSDDPMDAASKGPTPLNPRPVTHKALAKRRIDHGASSDDSPLSNQEVAQAGERARVSLAATAKRRIEYSDSSDASIRTDSEATDVEDDPSEGLDQVQDRVWHELQDDELLGRDTQSRGSPDRRERRGMRRRLLSSRTGSALDTEDGDIVAETGSHANMNDRSGSASGSITAVHSQDGVGGYSDSRSLTDHESTICDLGVDFGSFHLDVEAADDGGSSHRGEWSGRGFRHDLFTEDDRLDMAAHERDRAVKRKHAIRHIETFTLQLLSQLVDCLAVDNDRLRNIGGEEVSSSEVDEDEDTAEGAGAGQRPAHKRARELTIVMVDRKTGFPKTIRFPRTVGIDRTPSSIRLARFVRVAEIIHEALLQDIVVTKRDIYYQDVNLFGRQAVVDELVDDLAVSGDMLRCDLNVRASAKGLVAASDLAMLMRTGEVIQVSSRRGTLIPPGDTILRVLADDSPSWILILEKDAVFQTLCSISFAEDSELGPGILITGKGFPDLSTIQLVRMLADSFPNAVIGALVDADPSGISILNVYRHGSDKSRFSLDVEGLALGVRLHWLGLHVSDWASMGLDADLLLPLTNRDALLAQRMLAKAEGADIQDERMQRELRFMLDHHKKAEMQILCSFARDLAQIGSALGGSGPQLLSDDSAARAEQGDSVGAFGAVRDDQDRQSSGDGVDAAQPGARLVMGRRISLSDIGADILLATERTDIHLDVSATAPLARDRDASAQGDHSGRSLFGGALSQPLDSQVESDRLEGHNDAASRPMQLIAMERADSMSVDARYQDDRQDNGLVAYLRARLRDLIRAQSSIGVESTARD